MLQKKNEGILFSAEIRVVGSYTDRLLTCLVVYDITKNLLEKENQNWNLKERFCFYLKKNCFVTFQKFRWLRMGQIYVCSYEQL